MNVSVKTTTADEAHLIMIKGSIHQEDITILNTDILYNRALKYMKQKLIELQGKIDQSTAIVSDFNILLSIINKTSRQNSLRIQKT